jgi:stage V sporulation protein G
VNCRSNGTNKKSYYNYLLHEGGYKVEVTDVRIRRLAQDGKMRAIVSITLNERFVVHDVRVIEGNNGLFVAMPSKRTPNGEFRDIAHPINAETRAIIQKSVLDAYTREMGVAAQPAVEIGLE